jgi:hypothetical protein
MYVSLLALVDGIVLGSDSIILHVVHHASVFIDKAPDLANKFRSHSLEFVGEDSVNHTVHHDVHVVQVHHGGVPCRMSPIEVQVWLLVLIDLFN